MATYVNHMMPARWTKALDALMVTPHLVSAATHAGVTVRTLRRWLTCPAFQAAFRERSSEAFKNAAATAESMVGDALKVLHKLALTGSEKAQGDAADAIVRHAFKWREINAIMSRLESLERSLQERQPSHMDPLTLRLRNEMGKD